MGNSGNDLETSVCEEVFPSKDLLSYDDKYNSEMAKLKGWSPPVEKFRLILSLRLKKKIQSMA